MTSFASKVFASSGHGASSLTVEPSHHLVESDAAKNDAVHMLPSAGPANASTRIQCKSGDGAVVQLSRRSAFFHIANQEAPVCWQVACPGQDLLQ